MASMEGEPERIVRASHAPRDSLRYCDGMRNPFRDSAEKITGDVDEDTIELMLSEEQMRALSRAAATVAASPSARAAGPVAAAVAAPTAAPAAPASSSQESVAPAISDKSSSRKATAPSLHWPAGGIAAIVGVTVVLSTLVALHAIAQRTSERKLLAAAAPAPTTVVTAPPISSPSPPATEPMRFKNPFDRSEVFEFPPGTTPAAARQAVAELLMERARDRHVKFVERKHGALRKAAVRAELAQNSVR